MLPKSGRSLGTLVLACLLVATLCAACGNRHSHQELLAAAQGSGGSSEFSQTGAGAATGGDAGSAGAQQAAGVAGAAGSSASGPVSGGGRAASGAASTGGASGGAGGSAAKGAPIVIGSVGTQSGIVGASISDGTRVLQAWAAGVNAQGGIKGHPVQVIVGDDGGDPSRHQQLVQQFVEEKHVAAFVYNSAPLSGQSSVQYLTQKRVPVIGSELGGQWFYTSPMFFPQTSSGLALTYVNIAGIAGFVVPKGKTKVATLTCQEAQFCTDANRIWPQMAPSLGFQVVSQGRASLAQPDFTSECLSAKNANAQVLLMAMDTNSVGRVASSCARVDFHPVFSFATTVTVDRLRSDPNLDGTVLALPLAPWFQTSNASVAQYKDTMARYAPGNTPTASGENGWASAKLFELAETRASDPTTSAGVLDGLWSIKNETLGGLIPATTFTKDQNAPEVKCWSVVVISGGQFTAPEGGQMHCA
ncbi:MAG TPA: ABC transporter substrate-binding protein [Acidimicrobiales bacterium]|nr:ABC transporter substrate-binding protein [Acidimicrobiales bacterium]